MRAHARVHAETTAAGGTRLTELSGGAPFALRETGEALYLVGSAQGLLADDDLALDLEVAPEAALSIRSAAATIAYASAGAELSVRACVGAGGSLTWHPEPLIATARCRVGVHARVELEPGASLDWTEECVLGRAGEEPGSLTLSLGVTLAGRVLLRHELVIGPDVPGWDGPAVIGTARAVGLRLLVGAGADLPARCGAGFAVLRLAEDASVVNALGRDLLELRRAFAAAVAPP